MKADNYLKELTKRIEDPDARKEIMREYQEHIEDCRAALMESGMSEEEAEEEAVRQMGDPASAGRELNRIYRRIVDVSMLLWFLAGATFVLVSLEVCKRFGGLEVVTDGVPPVVHHVIGAVLILYGLALSAWEKYYDFELFYAHARDWGRGVANSGLGLAIAVGFLSDTVAKGICVLLAVAVVQTLIRSMMILLNNRREIKLLWEIGVADTTVTYKGKGTFCGKRMKIKTKEGEIQPGTPIMIVSIEDARPVVVRV